MHLSPEQIDAALAAAEQMRARDQDPELVGHALLQLHARNRALEEVLQRAKHFLHSGQASHEHSLLTRAIEQADRNQRELMGAG